MNTNSHIPILKRLFISYVLDGEYTIEKLENMEENKIEPSAFFKNFNIDKINSLDSLTVLLDTIFKDKDSPAFELEYKIYLFYSKLSSIERKILYDFYVSCISDYEIEPNLNFNADNDKIPKDLSKFIFYNSINFFDEFDVSDGYIDVEYLLNVINHYSNNFKFDVKHLLNDLLTF